MEGICFVAKWQAQVGEEFRIVFSLAPRGAAPAKPVRAHAKVRHCIETQDGFSMGVQFLQ